MNMPIKIPILEFRNSLNTREPIEDIVHITRDAVLENRTSGRFVSYDLLPLWEPLDRIFRRSEDYA